ncbi:uncharacterized protein C7orf57-like [Montipora capricornis]|uniref:uncharacterized protein C7orf57-like n=1 Tax=Montipora capricornis TaxID=246305 RepID=UPI0035F17C64
MVKPFYKPLDRPEGEEIRYCYLNPIRKKQDLKNSKKIPPISQVPDLTKESGKVHIDQQKNNKARRVLENDSKYLKLAKTGGRKSLLCYRENERRNSRPKLYEVPEWYCHEDEKPSEERELSEEEKHKKYKVTYGKRSYKTLEKPKTYERPDYMTHLEPKEMKEIRTVSDRIPDRPIFGYDSFSFWKRDELEKSNKLPLLVPEANIVRRQKKPRQVIETGKEKLPARAKAIAMSGHRKLASSGYATKWHEKWYVQGTDYKDSVSVIKLV